MEGANRFIFEQDRIQEMHVVRVAIADTLLRQGGRRYAAFFQRNDVAIGTLAHETGEQPAVAIVQESPGDSALGAQSIQHFRGRLAVIERQGRPAVGPDHLGQDRELLVQHPSQCEGCVQQECQRTHQQNQAAHGHHDDRELTMDGPVSETPVISLLLLLAQSIKSEALCVHDHLVALTRNVRPSCSIPPRLPTYSRYSSA